MQSLIGALIHMHRSILNLAKRCAPLRPLLSKKTEGKLEEEHKNAYQTRKKEIQKVTEIKHFKKRTNLYGSSATAVENIRGSPTAENRRRLDDNTLCITILNTFEKNIFNCRTRTSCSCLGHRKLHKSSIRYTIRIVSNHKALTTLFKENRANKTYSSMLIRCVDKFLTFQFTLTHSAGRMLGMAYYLRMHPSPSNKNNQTKAEEI